ncbi:MAG: thioredoxin domain-containing protein [Deltaproteobacteria bacterium]|nr:thioredoxin domain-containing protein [Deltaproteobacteria bacterium]
MKNALTFCLVILALGCSKGISTPKNTVSGGTQDVVATIGEVKITDAELTEAAKSQLKKLDTEIYQIKKNALDDMIEEKLIADAAKKKNMTPAVFLREEVDSKVTDPTEDEIKAFYNARKGPDTPDYATAKPQIIGYLRGNQQNKARRELLASLRKEANVKVSLEVPRIEIDLSDAPSVGPQNAKVTLVEFSDYQCPFCARVRPTIWRLVEEYKNDLKYVFFDFPLSFHKDAQKAHEAAYCADDQGKYFEFHKKLFDQQRNIKPEDLKKYAKELQLNQKKFDECLDSGKYEARIRENTQKGANAGVSGTPAFFVNGIMLSGAQPYEAFKEAIESELNR